MTDLIPTAEEQAAFDRHAQDYAWLRDGDNVSSGPLSRAQVREHYVKGMRARYDDAHLSDEIYILEWRNRFLAAKVKYLEGRLAPQQEREAG